MADQSRQERRFDLEAEQRQRRVFFAMVVGFALLAILGGFVLALWWISPPDEDVPPPMATKEAPMEPLRGFEPFEPEEEKAPVRRTGTLKSVLDDKDLDRGLGKIRQALNKCAAKHGAIDGTLVTVDFSVAGNGRVSEAYPRPPHKTPLGSCVAGVVRDKARFRKSRDGARDVRRTLKLRRASE